MQKDSNINLEFFRQLCKKHNLRITPQRIFIYKAVSSSQEHPNTEHLYKTVKYELPNTSFDTVHRTLLIFYNINLLNVFERFGNPKRFDPNLKNHHYLHCEKCGKIIDFTCEEYDKLHVPKILTSNFKINKKRIIISGLCKECQRS